MVVCLAGVWILYGGAQALLRRFLVWGRGRGFLNTEQTFFLAGGGMVAALSNLLVGGFWVAVSGFESRAKKN
jgi:hypothetical protein